jgi:hypothetical protein
MPATAPTTIDGEIQAIGTYTHRLTIQQIVLKEGKNQSGIIKGCFRVSLGEVGAFHCSSQGSCDHDWCYYY